MKKIAIIAGILISTLAFTQKRAYNFFGGNQQSEANVEAGVPGAPGDVQAAPIDQYLPILLLAGMAMAAYFARKKQVNTQF